MHVTLLLLSNQGKYKWCKHFYYFTDSILKFGWTCFLLLWNHFVCDVHRLFRPLLSFCIYLYFYCRQIGYALPHPPSRVSGLSSLLWFVPKLTALTWARPNADCLRLTAKCICLGVCTGVSAGQPRNANALKNGCQNVGLNQQLIGVVQSNHGGFQNQTSKFPPHPNRWQQMAALPLRFCFLLKDYFLPIVTKCFCSLVGNCLSWGLSYHIMHLDMTMAVIWCYAHMNLCN